MKHLLAAENFNIETSAVPHAYGEDGQQEYVTPKWTVIEHIHRGKFRQDSVCKLPTHERGFPVLRRTFGQNCSNDAPL